MSIAMETPPMEELRRKTTEHLQYHFSDPELLQLGKDMARQNQELARLEKKAKEIAAQIKGEIAAKEAEVSQSSQLLSNGYEYRTIDCEIWFHTPVMDKKTVVRLDTKEIVRESRMTAEERDEINQKDLLFEEVKES